MAKHIIEGQVQTKDHRIFTVRKVAASEQDVMLDFGAAVDYVVVKLDSLDLPPVDTDGQQIIWINDWGIMDASGNYVDSVNYTVFLPARSNASFIYYDHRGLGRDKTAAAKGTRKARPGMLQVDFSTGDPGAGWR